MQMAGSVGSGLNPPHEHCVHGLPSGRVAFLATSVIRVSLSAKSLPLRGPANRRHTRCLSLAGVVVLPPQLGRINQLRMRYDWIALPRAWPGGFAILAFGASESSHAFASMQGTKVPLARAAKVFRVNLLMQSNSA